MIEPGDNHLLETIKSVLTPIHPEGYVFIAMFAVVSLLLGLFWTPLGWLGLIATLWCAFFFRDPVRTVPLGEGLIVSPADGLVQKIVDVIPPPELEMGSEPLTRVSIFLNVFDVHINRTPVEGKVASLHYIPGSFVNASLDKASEENERQMVAIDAVDGKRYGVIQIAGLVARRIKCTLVDNQQVQRGERFGLIRFGSRTDVFLPKGVNPQVIVGQRAIGGETVIADSSKIEPARAGRQD